MTDLDEHLRLVRSRPAPDAETLRRVGDLLGSGRAIDDPAELAKAARIMRRAVARDRESYEERIRRIVDGAPPLSIDQRVRLAVLLSPAVDDLAHRSALADGRAEEDKRRSDIRRRLAAKKSPATIAREWLEEKIAALRDRPSQPDPVADLARQLQERSDLPWDEAYGQASAITASRRFDEQRRQNHADGHLWCVWPECPDAELDEDDHAAEGGATQSPSKEASDLQDPAVARAVLREDGEPQ